MRGSQDVYSFRPPNARGRQLVRVLGVMDEWKFPICIVNDITKDREESPGDSMSSLQGPLENPL